MKYYCLKHKYLQHFEYDEHNYLNYDIKEDLFCLESCEDTEYYQTIFTDEEIEKLVNEKGLSLQDWIKEEVKK